jgi:hypothetical protein
MAADRIPRAWLQVARRDLGGLAIHWTKAIGGGNSFSKRPRPKKEADAVLEQIMAAASLQGGNGYIKGDHTCVCFTETPLVEMVSVFASIALAGQADGLQYEPYGIGVPKEWLFRQGGRPVIYQSDAEYDQLPKDVRWRHCRFEPPDIDFTWEREWRVLTKRLVLDPAQTWVFVPNQATADRFTRKHSGWRIVPLELFGLPSTSTAVNRRET